MTDRPRRTDSSGTPSSVRLSETDDPLLDLRRLCGDMEDASVWTDLVQIIPLRLRLEAIASNFERQAKEKEEERRRSLATAGVVLACPVDVESTTGVFDHHGTNICDGCGVVLEEHEEIAVEDLLRERDMLAKSGEKLREERDRALALASGPPPKPKAGLTVVCSLCGQPWYGGHGDECPATIVVR